MSKVKIDFGIFLDIIVPIQHFQVFLDRIKAYPGCSLDINNCHADGDNYHIRVNCRALTQSAVFSLIKEISKELGMDTE